MVVQRDILNVSIPQPTTGAVLPLPEELGGENLTPSLPVGLWETCVSVRGRHTCPQEGLYVHTSPFTAA